jgi:hypothetical protein
LLNPDLILAFAFIVHLLVEPFNILQADIWAADPSVITLAAFQRHFSRPRLIFLCAFESHLLPVLPLLAPMAQDLPSTI